MCIATLHFCNRCRITKILNGQTRELLKTTEWIFLLRRWYLHLGPSVSIGQDLMDTEDTSPSIKRPGREAGHSPSSSA